MKRTSTTPTSAPALVIELRNVKHAAFASRATACFSASVYINGTARGTVQNDGQGGCDNIQPLALRRELADYARTLPALACKWIDPDTKAPALIPQSADGLIAAALDAALAQRDLSRKIKSHLMFTRSGVKGVYLVKPAEPAGLAKWISPAWVERTKQHYKAEAILNVLPFEQALQIYRDNA